MKETRQLYQTVWGDNTAELAEKVNNELKFGWKLQGGVCYAEATTLGRVRGIFMQALYQDVPKHNPQAQPEK